MILRIILFLLPSSGVLAFSEAGTYNAPFNWTLYIGMMFILIAIATGIAAVYSLKKPPTKVRAISKNRRYRNNKPI